MDDELLFSAKIDRYRSICLSVLPPQTLDETGADNLGGDRGYFIYEVNDSPVANGVSVLAKVASLDAASRLVDLWQDARRRSRRGGRRRPAQALRS
jgi:hypothetical protein